MQVLLFIIVIIGALITIAGGIWVAVALVKAISSKSKTTEGTTEFQDRP